MWDGFSTRPPPAGRPLRGRGRVENPSHIYIRSTCPARCLQWRRSVMRLPLFEVLSSLARAAGAPRVLCADDDPDVRALCATALSKAGFVTEVASNGREVLE